MSRISHVLFGLAFAALGISPSVFAESSLTNTSPASSNSPKSLSPKPSGVADDSVRTTGRTGVPDDSVRSSPNLNTTPNNAPSPDRNLPHPPGKP